jgi:pseudaminic acid biosynthesis-associated methylase
MSNAGNRTAQEDFWAGSFGDEYSDRNVGAGWIAANTALFSRILERTGHVGSLIEFGANVGLNLRAIDILKPGIELDAVEINAMAAERLAAWGRARVHQKSVFDFEPDRTWDLALIKGVLIHINPDRLGDVYDLLYRASRRFVCVVEYFNPTPVALPYRGHEERLFKRDFAGEMLDRFPDLRLVDYGFRYRRDPNFPQDDVTWFLMQKA